MTHPILRPMMQLTFFAISDCVVFVVPKERVFKSIWSERECFSIWLGIKYFVYKELSFFCINTGKSVAHLILKVLNGVSIFGSGL